MHRKTLSRPLSGKWAPPALLLVILIFPGCAQKGPSYEGKRLIEEYDAFLRVIGEDFDKLMAIDARYPKAMSNDVYLEYASEMSVQLQYAVNHLTVFNAFLQDNSRALEDAGVDVYGARMMVEDHLAFYANTASVIQATLQEIQYEEEQKKVRREELLESLSL